MKKLYIKPAIRIPEFDTEFFLLNASNKTVLTGTFGGNGGTENATTPMPVSDFMMDNNNEKGPWDDFSTSLTDGTGFGLDDY